MSIRARRRRLYCLGFGFAFITIALWVRLAQIQIVNHSYYKSKARKQWMRTVSVPAVRGTIFDRNGRPLALSSTSYSIIVFPSEVKRNKKESVEYLAKAVGMSKARIWKKLGSRKKPKTLARRLSLSEGDVKKLRAMRGVVVTREVGRTYPFGRVANKIVGFCDNDNRGGAGIEAAFDAELSGTPGEKRVILDGRNRILGLERYIGKRPENGHGVVLTIDSEIQELAENELARGLSESGARWGAVIIMDPRSGEIIALAEYPSAKSRRGASLVDSLWTIRSISYIYEPGSTFKLVTAAALLESGKVNPSDVFFAENGKARFGTSVIKDSHAYGYMTFREAFVLSSNIVMAKASMGIQAKEFYKFIRLFGFGAKTGVGLLGESPGRVPQLDEWSDRTQLTMAFGHEIAVTPLQTLCSFAAVANDGVLMQPSIVKAIIDDRGNIVKRFTPTRIRSVVSRNTALTLRSFCRDVVREGTGGAAEIQALKVAGKTGTGQKSSGSRGYLRGKYVASFAGFFPFEDPRFVCLVLLDEPKLGKHFGGTSAAPVFARISRAMTVSSGLLDEFLVDKVVKRKSRDVREIVVPNFLRMDVNEAISFARVHELKVLSNSNSGIVIAQSPDPGTHASEDRTIRLIADSGKDPASAVVPYLIGLSLREAKRKVVELGWKLYAEGSGEVVKQAPGPGIRNTRGKVRVRCSR